MPKDIIKDVDKKFNRSKGPKRRPPSQVHRNNAASNENEFSIDIKSFTNNNIISDQIVTNSKDILNKSSNTHDENLSTNIESITRLSDINQYTKKGSSEIETKPRIFNSNSDNIEFEGNVLKRSSLTSLFHDENNNDEITKKSNWSKIKIHDIKKFPKEPIKNISISSAKNIGSNFENQIHLPKPEKFMTKSFDNSVEKPKIEENINEFRKKSVEKVFPTSSSTEKQETPIRPPKPGKCISKESFNSAEKPKITENINQFPKEPIKSISFSSAKEKQETPIRPPKPGKCMTKESFNSAEKQKIEENINQFPKEPIKSISFSSAKNIGTNFENQIVLPKPEKFITKSYDNSVEKPKISENINQLRKKSIENVFLTTTSTEKKEKPIRPPKPEKFVTSESYNSAEKPKIEENINRFRKISVEKVSRTSTSTENQEKPIRPTIPGRFKIKEPANSVEKPKIEENINQFSKKSVDKVPPTSTPTDKKEKPIRPPKPEKFLTNESDNSSEKPKIEENINQFCEKSVEKVPLNDIATENQEKPIRPSSPGRFKIKESDNYIRKPRISDINNRFPKK